MNTRITTRLITGLLCLPAAGSLAACSDKGTDGNGNGHIEKLQLTIPDAQTSDCTATAVPILVKKFENVAGFEIHVGYDPDHMGFNSITSSYVTGSTINDSENTVRFIWADVQNLLTVPDNDTLALIHFENVSGEGDLDFDSATEVANDQGNPFDIILTDGSLECTAQ